jgi:hypothetical protein
MVRCGLILCIDHNQILNQSIQIKPYEKTSSLNRPIVFGYCGMCIAVLCFTRSPANSKIIGFGEDPAGEVYVLTNADTGPENATGGIYKLVKN